MLNITVSQQELEIFFLILVRITSFFYLAPFYGEVNVPARFKLGLGMFVSYLIYLVIPEQQLEYNSTIEHATLVIKESIVGLLIGFSGNICNTIIIFSGRIIDMDIGLAMANLYDPTTRDQISLSGGFYQKLFLVIFILSDMHLFLIKTIAETFTLIPIGGVTPSVTLYGSFVKFLGDYFIIGFRIVMPIFAVTLIANCAMGIMTKIAPQIHMFSIGMQMKILLGLLILFMTVVMIPNIADFLFDEMKTMIVEIIRGLT